jgi:hypothetical protein
VHCGKSIGHSVARCCGGSPHNGQVFDVDEDTFAIDGHAATNHGRPRDARFDLGYRGAHAIGSDLSAMKRGFRQNAVGLPWVAALDAAVQRPNGSRWDEAWAAGAALE